MKKQRTGRVSLPIAKLAAALGLAITLTLNACEEKKKQDGTTATEAATTMQEPVAAEKASGGTLTDTRDSKTYKIVKIGEQVWMAENLNYEAKGSTCYDNKPDNCQKYGRLYDWETAMKACPSGWKLPSKDEWQTLVDFAGGNEIAGKALKASSGWNDYEGKSVNGEDKYGFSALPGGYGYVGRDFSKVGDTGFWWTATEMDTGEDPDESAYGRDMGPYLVGIIGPSRNVDYSVRCIQN